MRATRILAAAAAGLVLAGCANAPKPLYHWEGYQRQVYQFLNAETANRLKVYPPLSLLRYAETV